MRSAAERNTSAEPGAVIPTMPHMRPIFSQPQPGSSPRRARLGIGAGCGIWGNFGKRNRTPRSNNTFALVKKFWHAHMLKERTKARSTKSYDQPNYFLKMKRA